MFRLNDYDHLRKKVIIQDIQIYIEEDKDVLQPEKPSFILADNIEIKRGASVFDLGTGTGLYAIVAAKLGASSCFGTDISPSAIFLARQNAAINGVNNKCIFKSGNLFEPFLSKKYNVIISNPPQTPIEYFNSYYRRNIKNDPIFIALNGGKDGIEFPLKVVSESHSHLVNGGSLYILIIKWHRWKDIISAMDECFSSVSEIYSEFVLAKLYSPSFRSYYFDLRNKKNQEWFSRGVDISVFKALK